MAQRTLFTIGHSTRSWAEFVAMLKNWKIEEVIDVRTVPRSRAVPQFSRERMEKALARSSIRYLHVAALGGLRHAKKDSPNAGWQNASFRGYADYMQTPQFAQGLAKLNQQRRRRRVCIMCAEAVWWRCHRRMIADAEVARGIPVKHIMSEKVAKPHELTEFAVVKKQRGRPPLITYPAAALKTPINSPIRATA
jgi:uncharacterized protein (DUF488 family)